MMHLLLPPQLPREREGWLVAITGTDSGYAFGVPPCDLSKVI